VVKPVDGSGGYGIPMGPTASQRESAVHFAAQLKAARRAISRKPVISLSTAPTFVERPYRTASCGSVLYSEWGPNLRHDRRLTCVALRKALAGG